MQRHARGNQERENSKNAIQMGKSGYLCINRNAMHSKNAFILLLTV